jgi:hypothetical protein
MAKKIPEPKADKAPATNNSPTVATEADTTSAEPQAKAPAPPAPMAVAESTDLREVEPDNGVPATLDARDVNQSPSPASDPGVQAADMAADSGQPSLYEIAKSIISTPEGRQMMLDLLAQDVVQPIAAPPVLGPRLVDSLESALARLGLPPAQVLSHRDHGDRFVIVTVAGRKHTVIKGT